MRRAGFAFVLAALLLAGCAGHPARPSERVSTLPVGWDEDAPERSQLATQPVYTIAQSSSFLVKGASYARYIVQVDEPLKDIELFFSSTNQYAGPGVRGPNVNDAAYHYEFMQVRPLGRNVRVMDVSAGPAFSNAQTEHTFTLAYIYGRHTNIQYLVPYHGDPAHWSLDPGYYELVIATDEELTVGINLNLHTALWTTYYHPQELGTSHPEALRTYVELWPGAAPRSVGDGFDEVVHANASERLNVFAFSNLIYRANVAAVGAQGTVSVAVDDREVPHRLETTGIAAEQPQRSEAYAYGVVFNEAGPVVHEVKTNLQFNEEVSLGSDLLAQMLVFALATNARETTTGVPTALA